MSLRTYARFAGMVLTLTVASLGIAAFAQRMSPEQPKVKNAQVASGKDAAHDDGPVRVRPESVLEKAVLAADRIAIPLAKAYALADIAAAQARVGQADQAKTTLRRSAEIIEGDRGDNILQVTKLAWLAKAQAIVGDRAGARATISEILKAAALIDHSDGRPSVFMAAALWQAEAGNAAGAIELVGADMKDTGHAMVVVRLRSRSAASRFRVEVSPAPASQWPRRPMRTPSECRERPRTTSQDRVRMLDAMRLAQVRGMAPFATAAAKAGDVDGAREMLARARIAADRRATHVEGLCFEQSKAGEERDALAWADGLPDPLLRAHALLGVARGIIEHNKRLDAK